MSNILKILIKSKNFGAVKNSVINKQNFVKFNKDYCQNLTRYNYNVKNLNVFEDHENSNFISEIELDITSEKFIDGHVDSTDLIHSLKKDDLFYLFRRKHYNDNLFLKINYLKPYDFPKESFENKDIFLL